ncbi:broad-complex core protein isoforms 1/2/3/4/5-like isoform X2 [Tigriopus californicus]|uniref:broad-complex core protein isoforms 1/2/3/4/5-like isoform X2 n=1 Tax=Tigriopus californicus TaxID=6832 RepID=UPI0027D9F336|nr:broad-complex core protein isoforms 1/2/3/4/5-like isoform X2 [Tigriopus californicus]
MASNTPSTTHTPPMEAKDSNAGPINNNSSSGHDNSGTGGGPGSLATPHQGDEHFCLKWNDYQDSIFHTLQDLRADEDFVDVTLVCDGTPLRAHQLMLSACSDFFREMLKNLSRQRSFQSHPVIVLWDISVEDMKKVLKFMYNGEVEVPQAHLNLFLSVAEKLRVRGLCQSGGKNTPEPAGSHPPKSPSSSPNSPSPTKFNHHPPDEAHSSKRIKIEANLGNHIEIRHCVAFKEESTTGTGSPKASTSFPDPGGPDDSLSRSVGGSEADFSMGGMANLAGMSPSGSMDQATAKEFWRRAMVGMNMPGGSALSSPNHSPSTPKPYTGGYGAYGGYGDGSYESTRRQRSVYSSQQIAQLESFFQMNEYIDGDRKRHLSQLTNIPELQIKVWFQNRRQKKKRELEELFQQRSNRPSRQSRYS